MNNRRMTVIYYLVAGGLLVSTQGFQKPKLISKKRPFSTTRLNTVVLPSSTKPNMKPPNPPRTPLISQVDHYVDVDVLDMVLIPSDTTFEDDHPYGPKTKLGHHLVDGLFLDALVLRTAPLESGHLTGHFTLF